VPYWIQFIWYLVAFFLVIGAAFYITRFIGQSSIKLGRSSNLEVIDFISLGREKGLYIIKVGNRFMLIGVTNSTITYLAEIEKEHVKMEKQKDFAVELNFSLERFRNLFKKDGDK